MARTALVRVLGRVSVIRAHDSVHAQDCADCECKEGRLNRITRHLSIGGAPDEVPRDKLRNIADKCPVHRTLTSDVKIETESV